MKRIVDEYTKELFDVYYSVQTAEVGYYPVLHKLIEKCCNYIVTGFADSS